MPEGISLSDFYYILPELVLTTGSLVVLIVDVLLPKDRRAALAWVTLAVLGATMVSLVPFRHTQVEVAHGLLAVDQFALFFKVVFLVAAGITVLMSVRYLEIEGASPGEYYFLILCATLGMMIMAGGIDLITIFIGLEDDGRVVLHPGRLHQAEPAIERGRGQVLPARRLLARHPPLRHVADVRPVGHDQPPRDGDLVRPGSRRTRGLVLAVILVVAGVGFKIAAVPFHMWAPDVYEGAPTPVTAFLVGRLQGRVVRDADPDLRRGAAVDGRRLAAALLDARGHHDDGRQRRRGDAVQRQAHAGVLVDRARRLRADRHRRRDLARHHRHARLPADLRVHAARRVRGHRRCCGGATSPARS
jgi:hypothetical protein